MLVSTADAAAQLRISKRTAAAVIAEAGFAQDIGTTLFVDHLAVRMAERTRLAGRRWSATTALAAFELLDAGTTELLRADTRSRLRAQLRALGAQAIAHRARGVIGRVRRVSAPRGTGRLQAVAEAAGMSALDARALGLYGGSAAEQLMRTSGCTEPEELVRAGVVDDAAGDIVLLAGAIGGASHARALVEAYLLGDTRVMRAAGDALEAKARLL